MDKEMLLNEFKNKCTYIDLFWINRYIKFISIFKLDKSIKNKTHIHHILPKSIFNEYSNLNYHKWNSCILSIRAHIIAHYMLAKALGGNMWTVLYFYKYNFNSKILSEINSNNYLLITNRLKNKVLSLDLKNNKRVIVDSVIFYANENLVGWNKGNKKVGYNISKSLNKVEDNGKTVAQNRALCGNKNPMFGKLGDKNPFFGNKHSEETKKLLSDKRKGCILSENTKKKISKKLKGVKKDSKNYKKFIYTIYKNNEIIYSSDDQRNISKYLKDNNLPSLFRLKRNDLNDFKFRKTIKSN